MGILWLVTGVIVVVFAFFVFWKCYFLRNPKRKIPSGNVMVSPADGKVIAVMPFDATNKKIKINKGARGQFGRIFTYTKDIAKKGTVISIFMSPMDVHYNRIPFSGKIIAQKHTHGKFYNAGNFFSSFLENEKNELVIQKGKLKIKVIQVAGFLARRIISFVRVGNMVTKGRVYGLINLGSQVTLIVPSSIKVTVKKGQRVYAGSSIIGRLP